MLMHVCLISSVLMLKHPNRVFIFSLSLFGVEEGSCVAVPLPLFLSIFILITRVFIFPLSLLGVEAVPVPCRVLFVGVSPFVALGWRQSSSTCPPPPP